MISENFENKTKETLNEKEVKVIDSPKAIPISDVVVNLPKSAKLSADNSSQKYRNLDESLLEDERITKSKNSPKSSDKKPESKINPCEELKSLQKENVDNKIEIAEELVEGKFKVLDDNKEELKAELSAQENTALKISKRKESSPKAIEDASPFGSEIIEVEKKPSRCLEKEKEIISSEGVVPEEDPNQIRITSSTQKKDVSDSSEEKPLIEEKASNSDTEEGEIIVKDSKSKMKEKALETETENRDSDESKNKDTINKSNLNTSNEKKESSSVKSN